MDVSSLDQAFTLTCDDELPDRELARASSAERTDRASPFFSVPASTESLLDQAYRLRYQVYCLERGFEDAHANPDGRERDEFDDHSVHRLLVHAETGLIVGGVRLVLPRRDRLESCFPIQDVCQVGPLQPALADELGQTAEISRFCVSKAFRRLLPKGRSRGLGQASRFDVEPAAFLPLMTLELMNAVIQMSEENGITQLCAAMEPSLLRLLSRLGLAFTPLGELVTFHGIRQPCYANIDELWVSLKEQNEDVWRWLSNQGGQSPLNLVQ